jgi:hippurate hydrolase
MLQVNIRYFRKPIRDLLLDAIKRVTEGVVKSAGLPASHIPGISLLPESVPPMTNDPALTSRVASALTRVLGTASVLRIDPLTGSEDFGVFGLVEPPLPLCYFRVGCADETGSCGFLHSSRFSPPPAVIRDATRALVIAAMELLPARSP